MNYKITARDGAKVTVEYTDGSHAELSINSTTTKSHFEQMVKDFAPKTDADVSVDWLSVGDKTTTEEEEEVIAPSTNPDWMIARIKAYGLPSEQVEYITENGLAAWQTKVSEIKTANPKPE